MLVSEKTRVEVRKAKGTQAERRAERVEEPTGRGGSLATSHVLPRGQRCCLVLWRRRSEKQALELKGNAKQFFFLRMCSSVMAIC